MQIYDYAFILQVFRVKRICKYVICIEYYKLRAASLDEMVLIIQRIAIKHWKFSAKVGKDNLTDNFLKYPRHNIFWYLGEGGYLERPPRRRYSNYRINLPSSMHNVRLEPPSTLAYGLCHFLSPTGSFISQQPSVQGIWDNLQAVVVGSHARKIVLSLH